MALPQRLPALSLQEINPLNNQKFLFKCFWCRLFLQNGSHSCVSLCLPHTEYTDGVDCNDDPDFILMIYESVSPGCVVFAAEALHAFYDTFPPTPKIHKRHKGKIHTAVRCNAFYGNTPALHQPVLCITSLFSIHILSHFLNTFIFFVKISTATSTDIYTNSTSLAQTAAASSGRERVP